MTDKTPKLRVDALGAIDSARDFVAGNSFSAYADDKMRRSAVERQLEISWRSVFPAGENGACAYWIGREFETCD